MAPDAIQQRIYAECVFLPLSIGRVHFQFYGCWMVFLFKFLKKLLLANSREPVQTQRYAASDQVFHCLRMSHKKDDRLIWAKVHKVMLMQVRKKSQFAKSCPIL